jgi:hypothetical protein
MTQTITNLLPEWLYSSSSSTLDDIRRDTQQGVGVRQNRVPTNIRSEHAEMIVDTPTGILRQPRGVPQRIRQGQPVQTVQGVQADETDYLRSAASTIPLLQAIGRNVRGQTVQNSDLQRALVQQQKADFLINGPKTGGLVNNLANRQINRHGANVNFDEARQVQKAEEQLYINMRTQQLAEGNFTAYIREVNDQEKVIAVKRELYGPPTIRQPFIDAPQPKDPPLFYEPGPEPKESLGNAFINRKRL